MFVSQSLSIFRVSIADERDLFSFMENACQCAWLIAKKWEFSWINTNSQTWSQKHCKLENRENINATFAADVEMEVSRVSALPPSKSVTVLERM